jgi:serine hydrolase
MPQLLIVPGLGGSGEHHWQTHLERSYPEAARVHQIDWNRPESVAWIDALSTAIERAPGAILVAHSLGCALVAHLAEQRKDLVVGAALLVAPADVDARPCVKEQLRGFSPMPYETLPFPSVVVASTNDPFMDIVRAREIAKAWESDFVNVGACGHINVESGFGRWPLAEELLDSLADLRSARLVKARPRLSGAL